MKRFTAGAIGLFAASALAVLGTPVTVQELGIGANEVVNITSSTLGGDVYAGVVKLSVNGTLTDSFCIDPWHWSSGNTSYDLIPLVNDSKPPEHIDAATALQIEQLWTLYYTSSISPENAAGLQIAIWDLVAASAANSLGVTANSLFHVNGTDWGASEMIDTLPTNTIPADLAAVTSLVDGKVLDGQDYVVPGVPDGGATLVLLGSGLLALMGIRRRLSA